MTATMLKAIPGLAAAFVGLLGPAMAQDPSPVNNPPSYGFANARPRIEVNPRPLYRHCTSWYVLQNRPSGTVLFPEQHCYWVRG